jgi:hypothetical protein
MARLRKRITTIFCGVALACIPAAAQDADAPPDGQSSPPAQTTQTPPAQNPPVSSSAAQPATQNPPAGQTSAAGTNVATGAKQRRYFYGFRIMAFPLRQFDTSARQSETTTPLADYTYDANSSSQKAALAGTFEYAWKPRLSIGVEFFLTHAKYVWTTNEKTGLPSPNSSTDDRPVTMYVQSNKANYWDLPILARYQGIRSKGMLSRAYWIAGPEYRHVGRVRTGTDIYYPDGTTGYNEIAAVPNHRDQVGAVVGIGVRFFDQFGFKLTPEVRYVRWFNDTFQGPGYAATKNEAEAALGFSF